MDDSLLLRPLELGRLEGSEFFDGVDARVLDFWRWALGDLRMNNARGYLVEFLVAKAVGSAEPLRVEWGPHDVTAPDGTRIEVKSTGYLQSWTQRRLSSPRFGFKGAKTVWDDTSATSHEPVHGRVDVWVLALQTCTDHASYDPLSVDQWEFWVLPECAVVALGQDGAALSTIQHIAGDGIQWADLKDAIRVAAIEQDRSRAGNSAT